MTDAAAAMAPRDHLTEFEGRQVLRTTVAVTKAGDGLSEALAIAPDELHIGQRVYVLLECEVGDIRFVPADKDDPDMGLVRRHTLNAGTATLVDPDDAKPQLAEQRDKILRAREAAAGVQRLTDAATLEDEQAALDEEDRTATAAVQDLANRRRGRGRKPAEGAE